MVVDWPLLPYSTALIEDWSVMPRRCLQVLG
jgi:hypothetical protein